MGTLTLSAQQTDAADVDNDGEISVFDYNYIQRYYNKTYYFAP